MYRENNSCWENSMYKEEEEKRFYIIKSLNVKRQQLLFNMLSPPIRNATAFVGARVRNGVWSDVCCLYLIAWVF